MGITEEEEEQAHRDGEHTHDPWTINIHGHLLGGFEEDTYDADLLGQEYFAWLNTEVSCYSGFTGAFLVYPFHEDCLEIFCRAIHGTPDTQLIDDHALDEAINKLRYMEEGLELDYGDINGPNEIWRCHPGEEYTIVRPVGVDQDLLPRLRGPCIVYQPALDLSKKLRNDPFASLPPEILDMILAYLLASSVAPARIASWALYKGAQSR
ncbi:hypothetical protein BDW69DRAFT_190335 [Aspergillus filifer]